jgi:hypothetical protein
MESQILDKSVAEQDALLITNLSRSYLNQIRKWTKFFAVLGYIMIGLMLVLGVFIGPIIGTVLSNIPYPGVGAMGGMLSVIYIVSAFIYIMPTIYLNRFSNRLKDALESNDNEQLEQSFGNMKSFYKFIGVLTIIMMSIYVLAIVVTVVVGVVQASM